MKQPSSDGAEKSSVTISTQTTDSLERPKSGRRKSGENVEEGDWKTLGDKASSADESEYQPNYDCNDSPKLTNFPQTSFQGHSLQPHTVRQKTRVHQETVHSQPVLAQTATYPQKLQPPPHLPPKQIYSQSLPHYKYYEIGPKVDSHHSNKLTVSSIEIYTLNSMVQHTLDMPLTTRRRYIEHFWTRTKTQKLIWITSATWIHMIRANHVIK